MRILEKNYDSIFNFFLCVLPVSFISMKLGNVLVFLFVLFNGFFFKKLIFTKKKIKLCLIIALPMLLDILFFWNNSSLYLVMKATEKHLLFLIFPIIIIGYNKKINLDKILKIYVALMLVVLIGLFIRYIVIYPENITKYLQGVHLWEMGYHFTSSFNNHAPALNMHLAFVCVTSFYLLIKIEEKKRLIHLLFQFFLLLFFVFYINTRVAVVSTIFGCVFVSVLTYLIKRNKKQIIKKTMILFILIAIGISSFVIVFPYSIKKFTEKSFANMDMVGRLDEFKNPEVEVYNKLVTRVSIWKSALELSSEKLLTGYGATEAKKELIEYYKETNQNFLYKYKFPVHNQYIDFLLKYGILGILSVFVFMFYIGYIGVIKKEPLIIFFVIHFFLSNLTDDFLILYSGISFSAFWFSLFGNYTLK